MVQYSRKWKRERTLRKKGMRQRGVVVVRRRRRVRDPDVPRVAPRRKARREMPERDLGA